MAESTTLRLLGPFHLAREGQELTVRGDKLRALLAYLASTSPQPQPRERLTTLFWGTRFEDNARQSLRHALSKLRKAVGPEILTADRTAVTLAEGAIDCDVARFEALAKDGSVDALRSAVVLYRGDYLSGLSLREEEFESWVAQERQRLKEMATAAFVSLAEKELESRQARQALELARRAVELDGYFESANRCVMRSLVALDQRSAALEHYHGFKTRLANDLSALPDEETETLRTHIEGGDGTTSGPPLVASHEETGEPVKPAKSSIAVLPFNNMSDDPEQEYFADGVAEDILTSLSRFPQLITVIDRHTSFTYKGRSVTAKQVGQELGVAYMLEGSVRRSGGRVRITAQLIDCATGGHLWAERYDRSLEDIFAVQDEITRHISTALSIKLTYGTYVGKWMRGTENFEAWDAVTKGTFEYLKFSREGMQSALAAADRALALDPDYGTAFALKGWCFAGIARYFASDREPLWEQARFFAEKAMTFDASKPLGLALVGYCQMNAKQFEQAIETINAAIALAPTAENHFFLGQAYLYLGRPKESIAQTEQAMRLSPLCPGYFLFNMTEGHRLLGHTDEALLWAEKCIAEMPESYLPLVRMAALLALAGRHKEAEDLVKQITAQDPEFSVAIWAKGQPFRDPAHIDPLAEALRQLGLPD